jgi:HAMP domain-containing protein
LTGKCLPASQASSSVSGAARNAAAERVLSARLPEAFYSACICLTNDRQQEKAEPSTLPNRFFPCKGAAMLLPSNISIKIKYLVVLLLTTAVLVVVAPLSGMRALKLRQLRHEAKSVADLVVSLRSWVSQTGVVWVDHLADGLPDFLGERKTETGSFFSKNPALVTREVSGIASKSNCRATFRVTSDNYCNPLNVPDSFEIKAIQALKNDRSKTYAEAFEGGYYRYAQPIYITKECLKCHGKPDDAPRELLGKYRDSKAFYYEEGMLRGIVSVKLPDMPLWDLVTAMITPYSVVLLLVTLLLNLLFIQRVIVRRLKKLATVAADISEGDLHLAPDISQNLRDEVDQVSYSIDRLRTSLLVVAGQLRKKEKHHPDV